MGFNTPTFTQEEKPIALREPLSATDQESIRSDLMGLDVAPVGQTTILDIRTCGYSLSQVMASVGIAQGMFPSHEIFMDGDEYAIVARARGVSA